MLLEPNHPAGEVVVVFGKVAEKKQAVCLSTA